MSRTMKRRILAVIACVVVCSALFALYYFFKPAPTMSARDFTTKDQALAIRLTSVYIAGDTSLIPKTGYTVLADPSGNIRAFQCGKMDSAKLVWTHAGVFYGGPDQEFFTNEEGTKVLSRDIKPSIEYARYPRNNVQGFMAFYGVGGTPDGYKQPVLLGDSEKTESIDVRGGYMSMGACDDALYAITQTIHAPNLFDQAKEVYQKHSGVSDEELAQMENFDVLVQAYPANHPQNPQVLESIPYRRGVVHAHTCYQRLGDCIYLLSFKFDFPDAEPGDGKDHRAGHGVLEEWNLKDHTYRLIDVVDEKGNFVGSNLGVCRARGVLQGTSCYYLTSGKVFSIDMATGAAKQLYEFEDLPDGKEYAKFKITPSAVYCLVRGKDKDDPLEFSRYVFKTGTYEHLFDVSSLAEYRKNNVGISDIAINPAWEESLNSE